MSEKRFERADLPARLFRLCGNKTSLGKRMQKFEGTSWAGQGNWSKERWNSWYDHPGNLLLATVKLVLYQQTSETQIHGFKRSYYFKYQKVLEKKLNWIDSTLYYRLLLIRCWESFILQWKEPSAKKKEVQVLVTYLQSCKSSLFTWVKKIILRIMILWNDRNVWY